MLLLFPDTRSSLLHLATLSCIVLKIRLQTAGILEVHIGLRDRLAYRALEKNQEHTAMSCFNVTYVTEASQSNTISAQTLVYQCWVEQSWKFGIWYIFGRFEVCNFSKKTNIFLSMYVHNFEFGIFRFDLTLRPWNRITSFANTSKENYLEAIRGYGHSGHTFL